jgi:hypothetical protein
VFAALCAVDYISIGMTVAAVIELARAPDAEELRSFECAPGALALARRLEAAGREALIGALHAIVTGRVGGAPCLFDCARSGGDCDSDSAQCSCAQFAAEYPAAAAAMRECAQADGAQADGAQADGAQADGASPAARAHAGGAPAACARILEQVFSDYLFARQPPARIRSMQLVDAYNFNNTIENVSSTNFARWPRWALPSEIEKHLGALKMTDLFADGVEGFLASIAGRELPLELLAAQSHARAAQLDGAAASNASSWIDE